MKTFSMFATPLLLALAPPSPNVMRSAIAPLVMLEAGKTIRLQGSTDGKQTVEAAIAISAQGGMLSAVSVSQDGKALTLPESAWQGLEGARHAWLEERGALTTLVVEGESEGKDWRLALEFHPRQLWLRRLSREGEAKDSFIFYDRDNLKPQKERFRRKLSRGFHE